MPLWLSISLLLAAIIVILYLLYLVVSNRRWIRLHAFTAFAAGYFALPAFKLVVKAYGFNVDADFGGPDWVKDVLAGLVLTYLFILEYQYQKSESHHKYFYEFRQVILDNVRDGIEDTKIARTRKLPLDKVQAIIMCLGWLDMNLHKKPADNGIGESEGGR